MQKNLKLGALASLITTAVVLIPLEMKVLGWILLCITTLILLLCEKSFKRDMLLVVLSIGLLGMTHITTDISYVHIAQMGSTLLLAIIIPFLITRNIYKEKTITFPSRKKMVQT